MMQNIRVDRKNTPRSRQLESGFVEKVGEPRSFWRHQMSLLLGCVCVCFCVKHVNCTDRPTY